MTSTLLCAIAFLVSAVTAAGGTGPFKPADAKLEPTLDNKHTIYAPTTLPEGKLPLIVWGNGGCVANGKSFEVFLTEIASHGFIVIANGSPTGSSSSFSQTSVKWLSESIDWAHKAGGKWVGKIDTDKIAAAGQSCGGLEASDISISDPRIKATGIFNSGYFQSSKPKLAGLKTKTIGYFLGGSSDIAYNNGMRDYKDLPAKMPAFVANLPVGHVATYFQKDAGKFGVAAVNFFKWQLKGDAKAATYFVGANPGIKADGWTNDSKNLAA